MNELLQVFTAFGVMVAGDKPIERPEPNEKRMARRIDEEPMKGDRVPADKNSSKEDHFETK